MRRPLVAGNWKMNKLIGEARDLALAIAEGLAASQGKETAPEVVLGPPYLALPAVAGEIGGREIGAMKDYGSWHQSWTYYEGEERVEVQLSRG